MSLLNVLTSSFIRRNCSVFDIKYDGGYPNPGYHFPQTRLGKHYSRQKSSDTADKKKPWPHSKQVAGTSKRVCLLDGKAVAPTTSVPEAQKAKQANKKTSET